VASPYTIMDRDPFTETPCWRT